MTQQELTQTWQAYFESKTAEQPNKSLQMKLVEHYYPLIRSIAIRMHQRINDVSTDELTSMGVDGLIDAVKNYDSSRNTKFETYATPRIKGSMLDEIRTGDWVPRLVRSNVSKLDILRSVLESRVGHKLTVAEMADEIGVPTEEFDCLIKAASTPAMHSVNELNNDSEKSKTGGLENIKDESAIQPIERILRREFFHKLMGKNFTPQERKIMWLYYFEDLSMKEISLMVKLSESRVSQMHGDICDRLQQKAKNNPEYFEDIGSVVSDFKEAVSI